MGALRFVDETFISTNGDGLSKIKKKHPKDNIRMFRFDGSEEE